MEVTYCILDRRLQKRITLSIPMHCYVLNQLYRRNAWVKQNVQVMSCGAHFHLSGEERIRFPCRAKDNLAT